MTTDRCITNRLASLTLAIGIALAMLGNALAAEPEESGPFLSARYDVVYKDSGWGAFEATILLPSKSDGSRDTSGAPYPGVVVASGLLADLRFAESGTPPTPGDSAGGCETIRWDRAVAPAALGLAYALVLLWLFLRKSSAARTR